MTSHLLHPHSAFYLQAALIGAVLTLLQHAVPTLGVSSQFSTAAPVLALLEEDATASLCYLERQPTLLFLPNGTQTSLPQPDTEWITNTTRDTPPPGAARSKRSYSYDRHIEIMVVADPKMAKYHGDNLHHYVLTLMATVALIYRDASIGNAINIAIVKLMIMDEDEGRDIIYNSASKTLRHFCRWQQMHNRHSDGHPHHHDVAILLTREDLCRMPKTCDTLGLAQLGQICDPLSSCAVIEDNGLSAAFTIAHELAHVLSIPHDDTDKCSRFREEGQRYHIMSRMLDYNSHPWTWSACSRHFLTEFLDGGNGDCLLDSPATNLLEDALPRSDYADTSELSSRQPGELFDMDYQCELVFGPTSKICPYMPVCKRLWCTIGLNGGCRTQHMPWADGTSCGRHKWCQQGECVSVSQTRNYPIDGQWGSWSVFTPCSRECGGGIQKSTRECDHPRPSHGGKYCTGHRVRYRSCNTHECAPGSIDFRAEQCAAFNGQTFDIQGLPSNVRWSPHYTGIVSSDSCKLNCNVIGTGAYYLLKHKVIDGTPCSPDSYDICVNGRCMSAGCDHILGSNKQPDSCGVCGGDNTTCRVVAGRFNQVQVNYGYNSVTLLPPNTTNVDIRQLGLSTDDNNYLALRGEDGNYILNGDFVVSMFRKTIQYGGTTIEYSGSNTAIERVNASKPIEKALYVEVLSVGSLQSPDIRYQFAVSLDSNEVHRAHRLERPMGAWEKNEWDECTRECGGGIQTRQVWCISRTNFSRISDEFCDESIKFARTQRCNEKECPKKPPYRWYIGPWTKCTSSGCTSAGTRKRLVLCISAKEEKVPLGHCGASSPDDTQDCEAVLIKCPNRLSTRSPAFAKSLFVPTSSTTTSTTTSTSTTTTTTTTSTTTTTPAPTTRRAAAKASSPKGKWLYGDWEPCTSRCGQGTQVRRPICYGGSSCPEEMKPDLEQRVCSRPCSLFEWKSHGWSSCSATCGKGYRTRTVECLDWAKSPVASDFCDPSSKPSAVKRCRRSACRFAWQMGTWSDCSRNCSHGVETRRVACHRVNEYGWVYPKPARRRNVTLVASIGSREKLAGWCNETARPVARRRCNLGPCPGESSKANILQGLWRPEAWQPCSVACGSGSQKRRVPCLSPQGKRIARSHCDHSQRPTRRRKCFLRPCAPISCLDIYKRAATQYSDGEYDIWVRGAFVKLYCSGMQVGRPVEYLTLRAGHFENFSEAFNKRQTQADACPQQSHERCANCLARDHNNPGSLTHFARVRINITSLLVHTNDFAFSETRSGWQIAFGEAGDCYPTKGCPQGQFKINLTGTGFIVSPKTKWRTEGNNVTKQVHRLKHGAIIEGKCGGHCGRCMPDKGLFLDLAPSEKSFVDSEEELWR